MKIKESKTLIIPAGTPVIIAGENRAVITKTPVIVILLEDVEIENEWELK